MISEEELRQDLAKLKDIVIAHKAPGAPLATHAETIDGIEYQVFTHAPANLGELYQLANAAEDETFLVYREERFSFAATLDLARRLARVLREDYGIEKGDRVAICARNCPEWCIAYMGISWIGAVVVPMNSWWQGPELEYGLSDSGSRLLLADEARLALVADYIEAQGLAAIAIKPERERHFPEFHALLRAADPLSSEELAARGVHPDDAATIMYTSGSTGHPKGVLSSHRAIVNALYTWLFVKEVNEILRPELVEEDPEFQPAILANVPLFHVTGSHAQFLASFIYLRKFVMMYKWDAEKALELIESERISVLHGVPTMTWEVMHSPNFTVTDLRSLRAVQAGGAPRPPEHLAMILKMFPEQAIPGLGYGLTETNAIGAIITGKFYAAKPDSTGRPTPPITSVRIVSDSGDEVGNGEMGEICIKGPTVMKGYWNNPEATAQVLREGWFHTGDIGLLDQHGFLKIVDRAKDIVIRGGENIACAEVEYAIAEHPAVSEVAVYGVPDERLGEVPVASIMLKPEQELSESQLLQFLVDRIAAFKIPARCHFQYEQLPRIASGKIAKKALRQQALA